LRPRQVAVMASSQACTARLDGLMVRARPEAYGQRSRCFLQADTLVPFSHEAPHKKGLAGMNATLA